MIIIVFEKKSVFAVIFKKSYGSYTFKTMHDSFIAKIMISRNKIAPSAGTERVDRIVCGNLRISHQRSGECTVPHDCTMVVVHEVWQCFPTTSKLTTVLTFLYFGFSILHFVAYSSRLHYANDAGSHNSIQSMKNCTGCCTNLYAVRACCTVCKLMLNVYEAMAEWAMFEADLWNADSLSSANFFRFRHCVNIAVQRDSFPALVQSGKVIFALQKNSKVSSSSAQWLYAFREKSIEKALLPDGFLTKLDLRNLQTQVVLFGGGGLDLHSPPPLHDDLRATHRPTD